MGLERLAFGINRKRGVWWGGNLLSHSIGIKDGLVSVQVP